MLPNCHANKMPSSMDIDGSTLVYISFRMIPDLASGGWGALGCPACFCVLLPCFFALLVLSVGLFAPLERFALEFGLRPRFCSSGLSPRRFGRCFWRPKRHNLQEFQQAHGLRGIDRSFVRFSCVFVMVFRPSERTVFDHVVLRFGV